MNTKYSLALYILLTLSIACTLWGINLWKPKFVMYGLLTVLLQIWLIDLLFKHRESSDSLANYLLIVPTALFMVMIIRNVSASLLISILISLLMLIPIHFLEKYIRYTYAEN
ncbi:MAG TPA: hypothetical protein VK077_10380 [Virgibacillus sp.]|nr:hypothetical protein [Virgibacillus sp.]